MGFANTARQLEAYTRRTELPFLMLHGGYEQEKIIREGIFKRVEPPRSRFGFALDRKHEFDLAFIRHVSRTEEVLREFDLDVVHITGRGAPPSAGGFLGQSVSGSIPRL
jgi:phosphatidylinositol alpha 1,6-mannosyltransferase